MLTLENDQLILQILDPRDDVERLGARYCAGGYIFQVADRRFGPLMSGPTYPDAFNTHDGQGIPDSFSLAPLRDPQTNEALVLGVGVCNLADVAVRERCSWDIEQHEASITFTTRQRYQGWNSKLVRTVALEDRTVRSHTILTNTGTRRIPITWFPHPFFPQPPETADALMKLNIVVSLPDNDSYELGANGFIRRKGWPWMDGHYQALSLDRGGELVIIQRHPTTGQVTATCSYAPTYFPIWGNENTFSWEPMIERTIAPAQTTSWQIDYCF